MFSLEIVLAFFLLLSCLLFSAVYSLIDNHSRSQYFRGFLENIKWYTLGFLFCALALNVLQVIFGQ